MIVVSNTSPIMTPTDMRDRLDRLLALNHQRHEEEVAAERLGKELR
jgi:hypothetical protein